MQSTKRRLVTVAALALATTTLACSDSPSAPADVDPQQGTQGSATSGGQTRSAATGLSVIPGSLALNVGTAGQLTAALVDASGAVVSVPTGALPWTSSSAAVATVSGAGVVTAIGAGEATIAVTSGGFTGTARVVVSP
jgi:uncharacterized protein YjdB